MKVTGRDDEESRRSSKGSTALISEAPTAPANPRTLTLVYAHLSVMATGIIPGLAPQGQHLVVRRSRWSGLLASLRPSSLVYDRST